jgi:putative sterol carrier protein
MAKRPIWRAKIIFKYAASKSANKRWKEGSCITFITSQDIKELSSDDMIKSRLTKCLKKKKDEVDVVIKQIQIISRHGETTDRF